MADTVTVKKLFEGHRHVVYQFTNKSDGTGESDVTKIDISTLTAQGAAPSKLDLINVEGEVSGFDYVEMKWDRDTDVQIGVYSGDVYEDHDRHGGVTDTGSGGTGDVLLSTVGGAVNSSYNIITKWRKKA